MKISTLIDELLIGSQKGIRDVIILIIPQVVAVVSGIVTAVLIARGLGPMNLGKYALILSVTGFAVSLSDLGISQTAIRYASRAYSLGDTDTQFAVLRWAFRVRFLIVLVVTAIFLIVGPIIADKLWNAKDLASLIRLGLLSVIFHAFASIPSIYFQTIKRFDKNALVSVGQTIILLIGILTIAWLNTWSVFWILVMTLLASAMGAFIFILMVPRLVFWRSFSLRKIPWRQLLEMWSSPRHHLGLDGTLDNVSLSTFAGFNLISTIIVVITMRLDIWLMGFYLNQSDIGIYSAASRFTIPLTIILGAITTALWPRASAQMSFQELNSLLKKTFFLSAIVAGVSLVYGIFFPILAPVLFGSDFENSILLGQILCIRYVFAILVCPIGVVGYGLGLVRVYWIINLIQLLVVAAINVFLLPKIGAIASAIALLVNDVIGSMIVLVVILNKVTKIKSIQNE